MLTAAVDPNSNRYKIQGAIGTGSFSILTDSESFHGPPFWLEMHGSHANHGCASGLALIFERAAGVIATWRRSF